MIPKDKLWTAVHNVDFKFILVPITFIFLRIWTCILTVVLVYIGLPFIGKASHSADGLIIALISLAVSENFIRYYFTVTFFLEGCG